MPSNEFRVTVKSRKELTVTTPSEAPYPVDVKPDDLRERTIEVFSSWLAENRPTSRELIVVLGSHLYELLFPPGVDGLFRATYNKQEPGKTLRVILEFQRDAEALATLPWEFIYVPDFKWDGNERGFFIAVGANLILARHVRVKPKGPPWRPDTKKVRIAIVVSQPRDQVTIDTQVINSIEKLATDYPNKIEIVGPLLNPSKEEFKAFVQEHTPQVVHFMGHGLYDPKKKEGRIAFVDKEAKGKARWFKDHTFADSFSIHRPELVFLHACEGAKSNSYRGFRGLALTLVHSGIPNVVAMQYPVENSVATEFAARFYESLGKGQFVDQAVQTGREALGTCLGGVENFSDRRFGSPVVYLQQGQGFLLVAQPEDPSPVPGTLGLCPCPNTTSCRELLPITADRCTSCRWWVIRCPACGQLMSRDRGACHCGYETSERKATLQKDPTVAAAALPLVEMATSGRQGGFAERGPVAAAALPQVEMATPSARSGILSETEESKAVRGRKSQNLH